MTSLGKVETHAGPAGKPAPAPALTVTDLRVWFDTPRGMVRAVDGVDLTVAPGTTLGIVGESGSGKSVLARTVMNILPRNGTVRPGSRIEIEGRDIAGLDRAEHRVPELLLRGGRLRVPCIVARVHEHLGAIGDRAAR